jgi:hypothetical protein
MKPNIHKDNQMKKFIILLSLVATTILLTSCGVYSDKYGDNWFNSNPKVDKY